jgi:hypothetical protein
MLDVAWHPLAKGCASFLIPRLRTTHKPVGTVSAEHCYAVFMRHYSHLRCFLDKPAVPPVVAELGPGSSLGTGLAALLAGAKQYVTLDVAVYRAIDRDLEILDRLVDLFRERAQNPVSGPYARIFPLPKDPAFPPEWESQLEVTMAPERLRRIRTDLAEGHGDIIRYIAPWSDLNRLQANTVDWLFSHAVLELWTTSILPTALPANGSDRVE